MDAVLTLLVPALVGVVVGVLSGLLGIGGGTLLVPIFRLMFGMSPLAATATSLFTIIPTSLSGLISHVRGGTCVVSLGLALGLGGALSSPLGVWLASVSPDWAIMLAAALVIGYSAFNMIAKAVRMPVHRDAATAHRDVAAAATVATADEADADDEDAKPRPSRKQLVQGAFIGLGAGVISGYVGVGGGFIMVPLMLSVLGLPMKKASGTSLIAVMMLAVPGVVSHALMGNVDYVAGLAIAAGSIPGALLGARFVRHVPEKTLRLLFGGFLLVAAALLVLNETTLLS